MSVCTVLRRALRLGAAVAAISFATACDDDDPLEPGEEPNVEIMQLTLGAQGPIGPQVVTVRLGGVVTGGPIRLGLGPRTVTATFFRADGSADPNVNSTSYELSVAGLNTNVATFSRTGAFTGTLIGVSNGTTAGRFGLYHRAEMHDDFGPFPVSITVAP